MLDKRRFLIVNADDFGQSPGINHGIIKAFEKGIVTSASLMVRFPAAIEAVKVIKSSLRKPPTSALAVGETKGPFSSKANPF